MDEVPEMRSFKFPAPEGETTADRPSPKPRRQFAYYPNMKSSNKPQKPFSRSAAKRESVMALGSIEHLQHYFTKTGIAAESNPLNKKNSGMVRAIGGPSNLVLGPPSQDDPKFVLPPSPVIPQIVRPAFAPYVRTHETDPENLRPGVIDDLSAVAARWELDGGLHVQDRELLTAGGELHLEVLELLKTTTHAIRSVRNYLVSLPDDSATPMQRNFFRPQSLQSASPLKRRVTQGDSSNEPHVRIRRDALEVLTVLRALEEAARLPLEHDAYDAQSEHSSSPDASAASERGPSPSLHLEEPAFVDSDTSVLISFIEVGGRQKPIPVWGDEAAAFDMTAEEREKHERWDERLVLGGGWLYRQDMRLADLVRERGVVGRYLDTVDEVLFGGTQDSKRGWERERERAESKERADRAKGRRVSTPLLEGGLSPRRSDRRVMSANMLDAMRDMVLTEEPEEMQSIAEEDTVEDDDLPDWAKRSTFEGNPLGRLHALLIALLPAHLLPYLPQAPPDRAAFLQALSSGQLLCMAYNVGVRKSRKQWGFVSKDAIHDIATLEKQLADDAQHQDKGKRGWTFRRTDNLRLWAAALKLRYSLPIYPPVQPRNSISPSDSTRSLKSSTSSSSLRPPPGCHEEPFMFDAPLVARQDNGWENMLETAVLKWMDAVVGERRGER
ncbi:uncharacterized protein LAESUDRAFT_715776 [Laetiporus sulphureus 93-53]|uniref:Uncharacterized protein n=1 Tax=Laetiporus sulphureus 93-53 TaxID=1314785 RepID=A0A165D2J1_9APHY|nr:uncharacterized protein LAESUDRAFT_715776 [Laetiporus sulphureus 93-53]KZT04027.1 hypothetical protein LAESUDRAFT_715776 [Laetiporus sulphureus 93-53]